jgi:hypothetical protein
MFQKWDIIEIWLFDTALHLNALYHYVKLKQTISKGFQVMLQTRQRTDRCTMRRLNALPSGSIKRALTLTIISEPENAYYMHN